ncbi:MAG: B12-binding domain-containing radical SAM protein [Candidatus Sumerlaeota bacterium]
MRILLVNPPNAGRSIAAERFAMDSFAKIFRGEPLALEILAGNLTDHHLRIIDLKAEPIHALDRAIETMQPHLVGLTAMTCEAPAVVNLAGRIREQRPEADIIVGGVHASGAPQYFNRSEFDYVAVGLAKSSLRELVDKIQSGEDSDAIPGIGKVKTGKSLSVPARRFSRSDLVEDKPPRYDLVDHLREHYDMRLAGLSMGFVVTACGCPFRCAFCSIAPLTGGKYLMHRPETILRDIRLAPADASIIRLVDANTFASPEPARNLAEKIGEADLGRQFMADVRSDTVVKHPELLKRWREIGLRTVVIGFEDISDKRLSDMDKRNTSAHNDRAIEILHGLGITIIGDFIIDPLYDEKDFAKLERYVLSRNIDLPVCSIMTPLPGTPLYEQRRDEILIHDLEYYTLTNAVTRTRLPEEDFYRRYADMMKVFHEEAHL